MMISFIKGKNLALNEKLIATLLLNLSNFF